MQRLSSLSIFFPAFNDAPSLPRLISRVHKAAKAVTNDFEIIVINDGSTDDTVTIVKKLQRTYRSLRLITHRKNKGYGGALLSGFAASKKDWVFYTDGDGQYDPAELTSLVRLITPEIDVVNGYKIQRHDPWYRIAIGTMYNMCLRFVFHPPIRDIDCDFRLIRRKFLQRVPLQSRSGAICLELIMKLKHQGAQFMETPVHHYERQHGRSRFFSLTPILQTARDLPTIYRFVHSPMKLN